MSRVKENIKKESIISLAERLVTEYVNEKGWQRVNEVRLDLQEIYETVLYPQFEYQLIQSIDLGYKDNAKVLGKVNNDDKVILIDRSISPPNDDPRFAFTLGHEFGHSVLHQEENEQFRCSSEDIFQHAANDTKEIQANLFAENLLMPKKYVLIFFQHCYNPNKPFTYMGRGDY